VTRRVVGLVFAAAALALPAAPAAACTGTVCDTINYVCSLGRPGSGCLPA
jgi:hypothetical protein